MELDVTIESVLDFSNGEDFEEIRSFVDKLQNHLLLFHSLISSRDGTNVLIIRKGSQEHEICIKKAKNSGYEITIQIIEMDPYGLAGYLEIPPESFIRGEGSLCSTPQILAFTLLDEEAQLVLLEEYFQIVEKY